MKFTNTKSLVVALLTFGLISTQSIVFAAENNVETAWVLVGDSPLLDRSSKNLFNGNTKTGIKYALKALVRSQSKFSPVIALHNLCIAYTSQNDLIRAAEYCAEAANTKMPMVSLKEIKPGLYKISRSKKVSAETMTLNSLIAQNLESNQPKNEVQKLARAN